MRPAGRPQVVVRVRSGPETVEVPAHWSASGGEVGFVVEIPAETLWAGDIPTPGRLALARESVAWSWAVLVDGVELPATAGSGTILFGPADRGRVDGVRVDFSARATGDTYATWSRRIFGHEEAPEGDADGDGRTNAAEFAGGSNPLDPGSVPGGSEAVPMRVALEADELVLRWPAAFGAMVAEEADDFDGTWRRLPSPPGTEGEDAVVRIPARSERRFYRLARP